MSALVLDSRLLALAVILLIASVMLFRRARGAATLLLLIGSSAYFLAHLHDFVISFAMSHGFIGPGSWVFAGCLERPELAVPAQILHIVSVLFPIGFLWYALRLGSKRV